MTTQIRLRTRDRTGLDCLLHMIYLLGNWSFDWAVSLKYRILVAVGGQLTDDFDGKLSICALAVLGGIKCLSRLLERVSAISSDTLPSKHQSLRMSNEWFEVHQAPCNQIDREVVNTWTVLPISTIFCD
jgi:hypothetical protein